MTLVEEGKLVFVVICYQSSEVGIKAVSLITELYWQPVRYKQLLRHNGISEV